MARNRKIKYLWKPRKLWKCRRKGTLIKGTLRGDSYAAQPAPSSESSAPGNPDEPTTPASAAPIPSHLTESDQAQRRACERHLVNLIHTRLENEGQEMPLEDLQKVQKMLCELKKQDIAAENHQLARAAAQAEQEELAAEQAVRNKPELSPEESSARLQQIINEIYGLDPYIIPPLQTAAPPAPPISPPAQPTIDDPPTPTPSPHSPLDPSAPRTLDPDPANPIPNSSQTNRLLPAESVVS